MVLSTLWCKNWRHLSTGGNSCKAKSPGQGNKGIFKERRHVKGRQYCLRKTANSRSSMTSVFSRSITRWKKIFTRLLLCYFKQLFSPGHFYFFLLNFYEKVMPISKSYYFYLLKPGTQFQHIWKIPKKA